MNEEPKMKPELKKVSIEVDGIKYNGFYRVENEAITVTSKDFQKKAAMLMKTPEEVMARMLLREIIKPYNGEMK